MTLNTSHLRSLTLAAVALAPLSFGGCEENAPTPPAPVTEPQVTAPQTPAVQPEGDAVAPVADVKPYPLDYCIVSGDKLGEMGEPVVIVHEGQEIKFCCDSCVPEFKKDPAKYMAELAAAQTSPTDAADTHDHADHDHEGHEH